MTSKKIKDKYALTNPADQLRHQQFKKDVDDLMFFGFIRFYTTHIHERTGEDSSNIAKYYKGEKPIGDNFWEKFRKAYSPELNRIRQEVDTTVPTIASRKLTPPPKASRTRKLSDNGPSKPNISDSTQDHTEERLAQIEKDITEIKKDIKELTAAVAILAQKIDAQSKPPRKKK